MAITLYFAPMSSASPVAFALAELGLDHELVTIDLKGDAHKQPEFLALNPMGQVPTLVDNGQAMFESSACITYLGEAYGVTRGLWPELGSARHMQALTWMAWFAVTLGSNIRQQFQNGAGAPEDMRNAKQAEAAANRFEELLQILDARLVHSYLLGGDFTLVDCYAGAVVGWSTGVLAFDLAKMPRVNAWVDRCMSRDSAKVMG